MKTETEMNTLNLTLKKKWFNLFKVGDKYIEYRDIKPYWISRLIKKEFQQKTIQELQNMVIENRRPFKTYEQVLFKNGYRNDSEFIRFNVFEIGICIGDKRFGASGLWQFYIRTNAYEKKQDTNF